MTFSGNNGEKSGWKSTSSKELKAVDVDDDIIKIPIS